MLLDFMGDILLLIHQLALSLLTVFLVVVLVAKSCPTLFYLFNLFFY